jgi:hypothetical protein
MVATLPHPWRHIEPDRLYASVQGVPLSEGENNHLFCCEFCSELLFFFRSQEATSSLREPDDKAA